MMKRTRRLTTATLTLALAASLASCTAEAGVDNETAIPVETSTVSGEEGAVKEVQQSLKDANSKVRNGLLKAQGAASKDGKDDIAGDLMSNFDESSHVLSLTYGDPERPQTIDIDVDEIVDSMALLGTADEFIVITTAENSQVESTFKGSLAKNKLEEDGVSVSTFTESEPVEEEKEVTTEDEAA